MMLFADWGALSSCIFRTELKEKKWRFDEFCCFFRNRFARGFKIKFKGESISISQSILSVAVLLPGLWLKREKVMIWRVLFVLSRALKLSLFLSIDIYLLLSCLCFSHTFGQLSNTCVCVFEMCGKLSKKRESLLFSNSKHNKEQPPKALRFEWIKKQSHLKKDNTHRFLLLDTTAAYCFCVSIKRERCAFLFSGWRVGAHIFLLLQPYTNKRKKNISKKANHH